MEDSISLKDLIDNNSVVEKSDLEKFLLFYTPTSDSNLSFNHMLLKWNNKQILESDFSEFIVNSIVYYVFKHSDYSKNGLVLKKHEQKIKDLFPDAAKRFAKKNSKTGEPGELILFLLLESQNIVQLVNKMNLKTSPEEFYKGSDAVHIQIKNNNVTLFFGESKIYTDFQGALTDAISSVEGFIDKKEDFEFDIISQHMDDSKFDNHVDQIKKLLLPYSANSLNYDKKYPVFLGFEWNELKNLPTNLESAETHFSNKYQNLHNNYNKKISSKIKKSKINTKTLDFYLIPFQNVTNFRKKFIGEITNDQ